MSRDELISLFLHTRAQTESLCENLAIEDYVIQSIEDVSPPKWHLAHVSWFFETFILSPFLPNYKIFDSYFSYLFNSYYQAVSKPFPRPKRGLLSRPTVAEIYNYRKHVDEHMIALFNLNQQEIDKKIFPLTILGIHHEQQHQELLLMDIKYNFFINPLLPSYSPNKIKQNNSTIPLEFIEVESGLVDIGFAEQQFCFDNERPKHQTFLNPYRIANRLITNKEYLEFIGDKGYQNPQWWLSDGWDKLQNEHWTSPLYWLNQDDEWYQFTLSGLQKLNLNEPVCHLNFYEANAYASWANKRLPLEEEWEHFVKTKKLKVSDKNNFLETKQFHPKAAQSNLSQQFFGNLWEWTASPYQPYPGFKPVKGALGEYNGKFMVNQMVLRGGSCLTPKRHIRATYRNFFQPEKRWQCSGLRLADNA